MFPFKESYDVLTCRIAKDGARSPRPLGRGRSSRLDAQRLRLQLPGLLHGLLSPGGAGPWAWPDVSMAFIEVS
jgi:hypothetical protein